MKFLDIRGKLAYASKYVVSIRTKVNFIFVSIIKKAFINGLGFKLYLL